MDENNYIKENLTQFSFNKYEGSFSFCKMCQKDINCCVRITPGGRIGNPILFKEDINRIEKFTKNDKNTFSNVPLDSNSVIRSMKSNENGCHFSQKGDCTIYPVRPLDCRLFPIDIKEKIDGSLIWIAYTAICPVTYDIQKCWGHAKLLLPYLKNNIKEYARANAPWMHDEPFVELGNIELVKSCYVLTKNNY